MHPSHCFLLAAIAFSSLQCLSAGNPVIDALKSKGGETKESNGVVTEVSFRDCTSLAAADYAIIRGIPGLKVLSLGLGANDTSLAALGVMPEVERFSTNGLDATDEGIRVLASWPKLKTFAMFHPGKSFTGTGLAALAESHVFESLTVAGSTKFGDVGMAAVGKLKGLKGFRTWHTGVTVEGVKHLAGLPNLSSLTLGQCLSYAPPTTLDDGVLPILAEIQSLESLGLGEARLSFDALTKLKALPKLKRLSLDGIQITGGDSRALEKQLPGAQVTWKAPSEAYIKRIDKLFGTSKG